MRIFVTGAGGFIGSRIASRLRNAGHEVVTHSRSLNGDLVPGSIPLDAEVIVNSAGRLGGRGVPLEEMEKSNAGIPAMIADHCGRTGARVIHLSTPGVTGLIPEASEDSPYAPWGDYERTKTLGERILLGEGSPDSEPVTVLRPDFVYGPGDRHKLPLFRKAAGGLFPLIGRRGARIRPTFVEDVCSAVEASLPGGRLSGGLYNIGGPDIVTVGDLALQAGECVGRRVLLLPVPRVALRLLLLLGPLCPPSLSQSRLRLLGEDHYVSIDRACAAGFQPEWPVPDGVAKTMEWYRNEGYLR
ncbi:MAG: hypothetical protein AVO35_08125 [Candidatus Aegiribacteria sp. MLS_C]|nr:MAG: hypothetical protein AVO35_08125 [Candidatus Aegiribacteria sp. MLS_C]